jgi:hypothetical protein
MTTPLAPPFYYCGIPSTGQSLSVGNTAAQVSTTQPFANIGLIDLTGVYATNAPNALTTTPLVAQWRNVISTNSWGANINGEDPATTCLNALSALALYNRYSPFVQCNHLVGISGAAIATISRGGGQNAYAATRCEVQALKRIANAASKTMGVPYLLCVNGESDADSVTFAADTKTLYDEYAQDLLTDSGNAIGPMFITQQNSTSQTTALPAVSSQQQVLAHTAYPGTIILAGPKYQLAYSGSPNQHITGPAQRQHGEILARAVWTKVFLGQTWNPLRPTTFSVVGAVVTITFNVPVGSLVFDTTFTAPHATGAFSMWANGKGFEASDQTGNLTISSVVIQNGNQVVLTLIAPPSTGLAIAYAYTSDTVCGSFTGPIRGGLLRDQAQYLTTTDLSPITGSKLPNWCVAFNQTGLT